MPPYLSIQCHASTLFLLLILPTPKPGYPKALLARMNTFLTLLIVFNLTMHIQKICSVPFLLIRHKPLPHLPGLRNGRGFFIRFNNRIHFRICCLKCLCSKLLLCRFCHRRYRCNCIPNICHLLRCINLFLLHSI